jgi:LmbE family N-acetylglucosaminyl deacetylase
MIIMTAPAIFYSPHQDDEVLSMSVDILNHVAAGREVIVVLYTTGKGSFVQDVLNGNGTSAYWGTLHNPYLEGYEELTDDDFSVDRNREFQSSLGQLGGFWCKKTRFCHTGNILL